jgi:hypothetical protein
MSRLRPRRMTTRATRHGRPWASGDHRKPVSMAAPLSPTVVRRRRPFALDPRLGRWLADPPIRHFRNRPAHRRGWSLRESYRWVNRTSVPSPGSTTTDAVSRPGSSSSSKRSSLPRLGVRSTDPGTPRSANSAGRSSSRGAGVVRCEGPVGAVTCCVFGSRLPARHASRDSSTSDVDPFDVALAMFNEARA